MPKLMSAIDPAHPRVVPGGIPFAIWLREQLERLGWSPIEAARQFDVSVEITRGYLRGFVFPTAVTLARIETAVGAKYGSPIKLKSTTLNIPAHLTTQGDDILVTLRIPRSKLMSLAT